MKNILNIVQSNIGSELTNSVNARDLHKALQVGRDYSNWIKDRINKYEFVENVDFVLLAKSGEKSESPKTEFAKTGELQNRGLKRVAIEYIISSNMAMQLAMVQNNEIGRSVRKYFIQMEEDFRTKHELSYELSQLRWSASRAKGKEVRNYYTKVIDKAQEHMEASNDKAGVGTMFAEQFVQRLTIHMNKALAITIPEDKETRNGLSTELLDTLQEVEGNLVGAVIDLLESGIAGTEVYEAIKSEIDYEIDEIDRKRKRKAMRRRKK